MSIQPKWMYNVNVISVKIQRQITEELDNLILKFTWKSKGPKTAQISLNQKNNFERDLPQEKKTTHKSTSDELRTEMSKANLKTLEDP